MWKSEKFSSPVSDVHFLSVEGRDNADGCPCGRSSDYGRSEADWWNAVVETLSGSHESENPCLVIEVHSPEFLGVRSRNRWKRAERKCICLVDKRHATVAVPVRRDGWVENTLDRAVVAEMVVGKIVFTEDDGGDLVVRRLELGESLERMKLRAVLMVWWRWLTAGQCGHEKEGKYWK